ncbi:MAG TPA: hypothetical protein VFR86_14830 [Burkholderiaceae bacterium]|nr:hypothetical protein [Burkholderiaceae bacterium]
MMIATNNMPLATALIAALSAVAAVGLGASAAAQAQQGAEPYVGRPIYSEPATGLQLPPGCRVEPTWRSRLGNRDVEVWVADCKGTARAWLLRRSMIEVLGPNQARLRFQILDEHIATGETAGESASVQCTARDGESGGFVVFGAKWRPVGQELRLASAQSVVRADLKTHRFVGAALSQVDCVRFPRREEQMRQLQQAR